MEQLPAAPLDTTMKELVLGTLNTLAALLLTCFYLSTPTPPSIHSLSLCNPFWGRGHCRVHLLTAASGVPVR